LPFDPSEHKTAKIPIEDMNKLLIAWQQFKETYIPDQLIEEITRCFKHYNRSGAVASFSGDITIEPDEIALLKSQVKIVYLWGSKSNCLKAFLEREAMEHRLPSTTNLIAHWELYDKTMLETLSEPLLMPYMIDVFNENGGRKTAQEIIKKAIKTDHFMNNLIRLCSRLLARR
jgi:hypothetical protein